MKVVFKQRSQAAVANCDWRQGVEIEIDGKVEFSAFDGEPEDSNLARQFNDIYHIPKLLQMAYDAGQRGEEWHVNLETSDEL